MNIKKTPWEKRNLGVDSSVEFYFEKGDKANELSDIVLNNTTYSYQVAHVPVGMIDILNRLVTYGFKFAETKIKLTADLKNLSLPCVFECFMDTIDYHEVSEDELHEVFNVMKGGVFATDKVALDPCFNARIAGKRYALWTQDEIDAGRGFVYMVTRSDNPIGFFVLKKSSEWMGDSFLAGLFDKDKDSGLGFSVLYLPMVEARKMGLKKMITGVSSNNPDSVKMHLALGYRIKSMNYTLVKHV